MDDISLGLYPGLRLCQLDLSSRPTMDCSGVHLFTVELLWTVFHKLLPPPSPPPHPQPPARPPTPSVRWPKIGAHLQKNNLK